MPREQIAELVPAAHCVSIPAAASALRRRRHRPDGFWLIRSGSVAMDLHVPGEGQIIVETLGMGDVLGWSWLVPPYVSMFGAVTMQPTEAFHFDARPVRALCEADPRLGYELTRRFLDVASNRLQASQGPAAGALRARPAVALTGRKAMRALPPQRPDRPET